MLSPISCRTVEDPYPILSAWQATDNAFVES